ncbi:hypothetical protein D3C81_1118310 [compost metagenome]
MGVQRRKANHIDKTYDHEILRLPGEVLTRSWQANAHNLLHIRTVPGNVIFTANRCRNFAVQNHEKNDDAEQAANDR